MAKPNRFKSNPSTNPKVTVDGQDFYGVAPERLQQIVQWRSEGRTVLMTAAEKALLKAKGLL